MYILSFAARLTLWDLNRLSIDYKSVEKIDKIPQKQKSLQIRKTAMLTFTSDSFFL
jgi:hypothetical protein